MGKRKRRESVAVETPPEGCYHYEEVGHVPWDLQKYFYQRHDIFSQYDRGIWMTEDAWFGVTPEPVADKIAQHLADGAPKDKTLIIDAFAGVGGNAIAFARSERWTRVFAIEKDPAVLACAKHNAEIYGVQDRITWYGGDCFEVIKEHMLEAGQHAVLFASPPWGGPGYRHDKVFDLSLMQPYNLMALLEPFRRLTRDVILYLPRTSDLRQLSGCGCGNEDTKITVVHYCMNGASKALCAYFGDSQVI